MKTKLHLSKCVACAFGLLLGTSAHAVWINEFHYDNTGADAGEFIEIAGSSGTDLAGYEILLYNGADGLLYRTLTLSGLIDNESNGYGSLAFDVVGTPNLQNGTPDGIALWDGTAIVQFLSYEGTFTAVDGHAAGKSSSDVGVSESSSTPVGHSLQLTGTGSSYNDFSWSAPVAESKGSINSGQEFPAPIVSVPDAGSSFILFSVALGFVGFASRRRLRD